MKKPKFKVGDLVILNSKSVDNVFHEGLIVGSVYRVEAVDNTCIILKDKIVDKKRCTLLPLELQNNEAAIDILTI